MVKQPDMFKHVYIDGDVLAYRASFSAQDKPFFKAKAKIDELMSYILEKTVLFSNGNDYTVCLTGKTNYRNEVAVTHPYKGNRVKGNPPEHLAPIREYLKDNYGAVTSVNEEADDLMSKGLTLDPENNVIASIDKDMLQVTGWHFEFAKNITRYTDDIFGRRFFYKQILTGDNIDNIKGLWRVGPAKADKIIGDTTDEQELYQKVLDAYNGDAERLLENARLLYLRRDDGELWLPPMERKGTKENED